MIIPELILYLTFLLIYIIKQINFIEKVKIDYFLYPTYCNITE